MSKQRLTDKTLASSVSLNDIIHIVKTSDTTQNPLGSSFKATVQQFASVVGGGGIFTGGTVTGPTTFTNGLTANTISTNTLTVNGVTITNIGNFITGGTYNNTTGILSLLNTTGGTVNITGFNTGGGGSSTFTGGTVSGPTIFVNGLTSTTISSTTATINTISATTATINTISATTATINTISATTATINTISATTATINTISATTATINTLSANTLTVNGVTITNIGNFITGGTYNSGTGVLSLLNTTGGTVNITGFNTGGGGGTFTGGTVTGPTTFTNGLTSNTISSTTISATSLYINGTLFNGDTYTTGFTYTPTTNTFTIKQNLNKPDLTVTINTMSGLTINGNLTFTGQSNNPVYSAGSGIFSAGTSVITLNFNNSSIQTITLTGNTQFATPLNFKDGAIYTLIVKQNATGGNNVSWFTPTFKWENGTFPGITTTPNGVDLITFISDGTSLYGLSAKNFS